DSIKVYMNSTRKRDPEAVYHARRFAYAYITPPEAPCRADPGPFIRRAFRTLALDLPQNFELLPDTCHGDMAVRFRTPDHREAAMRRQPFLLDGVTVRLVREGETPNVRRVTHDYLVHAALRDYVPRRAAHGGDDRGQLQRVRVRARDRPGLLRGARPLHRPRRPAERAPS
uniref:DUF4283 domain-containing protein n=1 Tax=Aegilops tauschii subsp. strangulata TaxID=200361 RepID=A0A453MAX9_AEGTS